MTKARDLANAGTALTSVSATELGYVDGVTSAIQTQIDSKEPTLPSQTGNSGKYLTTNGSTKSWGTVSQYSLPSQTGNSGKFLTTNGTSESWGTVNQPKTWTLRHWANSAIYAVAYSGSLYVAGGGSGYLATSSDGITWTSRTSQFGTSTIYRIIWVSALSLWVAVGQGGKISTSSDGITWTARTANMGTNNIYDVFASGSTIVAVGNGGGTTNTGGITYSTDGITWTRKSQSVTVGVQYNGVTYNGTNWIVVATTSANNALYASTPSGTWTAVAPNAADLGGIYWDGTRHIVSQYSAPNVYYTTSTTLSSLTTMSNYKNANADLPKFSYYNGRIYTGTNYLIDFSTTPDSTVTTKPSSVSSFTIPPSGRADDIINSTIDSYFAFSTGEIVCAYNGIFTSF